jgi:hypothetical protein
MPNFQDNPTCLIAGYQRGELANNWRSAEQVRSVCGAKLEIDEIIAQAGIAVLTADRARAVRGNEKSGAP